MKITIIASSEASTVLEVDIPVNPEISTSRQIEQYIEEHREELAREAEYYLKRNFCSDWKENFSLKVEI